MFSFHGGVCPERLCIIESNSDIFALGVCIFAAPTPSETPAPTPVVAEGPGPMAAPASGANTIVPSVAFTLLGAAAFFF